MDDYFYAVQKAAPQGICVFHGKSHESRHAIWATIRVSDMAGPNGCTLYDFAWVEKPQTYSVTKPYGEFPDSVQKSIRKSSGQTSIGEEAEINFELTNSPTLTYAEVNNMFPGTDFSEYMRKVSGKRDDALRNTPCILIGLTEAQVNELRNITAMRAERDRIIAELDERMSGVRITFQGVVAHIGDNEKSWETYRNRYDERIHRDQEIDELVRELKN